MGQPKYVVDLSEEEQAQLEALVRKGKSSARKQTRARILLKANQDMSVQEIMHALDVSEEMVRRARQRFVEEGLEAALHGQAAPGAEAQAERQAVCPFDCGGVQRYAGWTRPLDVAAAGRQGGRVGLFGIDQS